MPHFLQAIFLLLEIFIKTYVIKSDSIMLHVEITGSPDSPAVIVTHGVTDNGASQRDLIRRLSSNFQVFAIDTLGHGLSPRFTPQQLQDPFAAATEELAKTVREILAYKASIHALPTPLIGFGHSMGGALLSKLATQMPNAFRLLVLEDPAWIEDDARAGYRARAEENIAWYDEIAADPAATLAAVRAERTSWPADEFTGWLDGKIHVDRDFIRTGVVTFTEPWQDVASALRVPTYVVTSEHPETLVDIPAARAIDNPHLHVVLVDNKSHSVRREDVEDYQRVINEIFAAEGITVTGPGNSTCTKNYIVRPELQSVIDQTPEQTTWDLASMRAAGDEAFRPDPSSAPDTITPAGARIFNPPADKAQENFGVERIHLVRIHGGGYVAGTAAQGDESNRAWAELGYTVLSPDYRLAPEYPYPIPVSDCLRDIHEIPRGEPIILMGDSAGAGLAYQMLQNLDRPLVGLVLLEPCIDGTLASRSYTAHAGGPIWTREASDVAWQHYGGASVSVAQTLQAYPNVPPTLIVVNPVDPLRDEGIALATDLVDAGIEVELHMLRGTIHGAMEAPGVCEVVKAWVLNLTRDVLGR